MPDKFLQNIAQRSLFQQLQGTQSIIVLESWIGVSVQITGPSPPRPPLRDLRPSYSGNNNQAGNIMPCLGSAGGRAPSEGGGASSEL